MGYSVKWVDEHLGSVFAFPLALESQGHPTFICLDEVEQQAEKRGFPCAIVAYQSYKFAIADMIFANVHCGVFTETFFQVRYIDSHFSSRCALCNVDSNLESTLDLY